MDDGHHYPGLPVAHHKRHRPKHQRAGCLHCKPYKDERIGTLKGAEGQKPVLLMLQDSVPDAFQVQAERDQEREADELLRAAVAARRDARLARERWLELERHATALEAQAPAARLAAYRAREAEEQLAAERDIDVDVPDDAGPLRVPLLDGARLRAGRDKGTAMT